MPTPERNSGEPNAARADEVVGLGPRHHEGPHFDFESAAGSSLPAAVGPYRVTAELGRGRFGTVFAATDPGDGSEVAIKRITGEAADDPVMRERCLREARIAAGLDHPGVVRVLGVEPYDGGLLLKMERCGGLDLQRVLALRGGRRLRHAVAVSVVRQIAAALAYGHARGVVHRDVKPANIMVDPAPPCLGDDDAEAEVTARLLDFGLAFAPDDQLALTRSSMLVGTPLYMAPEQAAGDREGTGPATDVFGLGAVLYELLCGEAPFAGPSVTAILERLGDGVPTPPRKIDPQIPVDLETICLRCLRPEPAERYADAAELEADLARFADGAAIVGQPETLLESVRRRLRRPETPVVASRVAVTLLVIVMAWSGLNTVAVNLFLPEAPEVAEAITASVPPFFMFIVPQMLFMTWTAARPRIGRLARPVIAAGAALAGGHAIYLFAVLPGLVSPPLPVYEGRPYARVAVFGFLAILHAIAAAAIAVVALAPDRRRQRVYQ